MATQVQRRKGTTAQHSTFTGAIAELTVDTTKNTVVVHDGVTAGGTPLAKESGSALSPSSLTLSGGTANGVAYLNGSKVLTTGSALTFDGTRLTLDFGSTGTNRGIFKTGPNASFANVTGISLNGDLSDAGLAGLFGGGQSNTYLQSTTGGDIVHRLGNTEAMRLTSTGLGIGTSSPTQKLDVRGNSVAGNGTIATALTYDTNGLIGTLSNHSLGIITNSSVVARFDTAGNLGLGVTPSASWASSQGPAYQIGAFTSVFNNAYLGAAEIAYNTTRNGNDTYVYTNNGVAASRLQQRDGAFKFFTAPSGTAGDAISFSQVMTLTAAGDLLVGTTSTPNGGSVYYVAGGGTILTTQTTVSTACNHIVFRNSNGNVGSIQTSGSSTSFNTSSDYRLKENIQPMTGALAKVAALKPCIYKWKADGSDGEGFIAHELAEVVPQCVTGEKDAVDAEGKPLYQGIDTSFLVATLTAAIQELKAEFDAYKATHP